MSAFYSLVLADRRWTPPTVEVYPTDRLCRESVILTGNALTTLEVHKFDQWRIPCNGLSCWNCEDKTPKHLHAYISAVRPGGRRDHPQPEHCLIHFAGDDLVEQLLALAGIDSQFRQLCVRIRSANRVERPGRISRTLHELPRGIDPMPYMVRRWGTWPEYQLMSPGRVATIPADQLAVPGLVAVTIPHLDGNPLAAMAERQGLRRGVEEKGGQAS